MSAIKTVTEDQVWEWLNEVPDPEIPAISVVELGVVRSLVLMESKVEVTITPTYSGCPAMAVFEQDIEKHLIDKGFTSVEIKTVYNPAWTTDWMSDEAKAKLKASGIAPPEGSADKKSLFGDPKQITCPSCDSRDTTMISQFGSTACKALWKCNSCLDTFHYFKCI